MDLSPKKQIPLPCLPGRDAKNTRKEGREEGVTNWRVTVTRAVRRKGLLLVTRRGWASGWKWGTKVEEERDQGLEEE